MFCVWADNLYAEGDMKCILNSALCGAAHKVPQLRGSSNGAWRLYKAWSKVEKPAQAPGLTRLVAQAMAAAFVMEGEPAAAIMILVAHDCILRTSEFMELRTTDVVAGKEGMLLTLRDTKIGQRFGVQQDVLSQHVKSHLCLDGTLDPLIQKLLAPLLVDLDFNLPSKKTR